MTQCRKEIFPLEGKAQDHNTLFIERMDVILLGIFLESLESH